MHASIRACLPLVLLALAACSPRERQEAASPPPPAAATEAAPVAVAAGQAEEEECTNEPRTDENDKRPRCGGMGTPRLEHAYRITLDNGESITACDITKPFSGKIGGGMVTMSFTPADQRNGTVAWHFAGGGGMADTAYDYTLSGPEEKMTGSFRASAAICGQAAGKGGCAVAQRQTFSSTWTRIEDCDK